MFLLIFAIILLLGLLALLKIHVPNKLNIITIIVIILIITNLANELIVTYRNYSIFDSEHKHIAVHLSPQLYKQSLNKTLMKEQHRIVDYLNERVKNNQNILLHIPNLNSQRFRIVFQEFQRNAKVLACELDFKETNKEINTLNLKHILKKHKEQKIFFIFENYHSRNQLTQLKYLYLKNKVSIILKSLPEDFYLHSISDFTEILQIQSNYFVQQMYKTHPPKIVNLCNKYATIDYDFYVQSQNVPLNQLCSENLPSNEITKCIRNYLKSQDDFVPYAQVKHCFTEISDNQLISRDGIIFSQGEVGLKKQYFWAGKVEKSQFSNTDNQL